jgi:hypothetical protein
VRSTSPGTWNEAQAAEWDRLAYALNQQGIHHVAPHIQPIMPVPSEPEALFTALFTTSDVRLQESSIALLLTHPDFAHSATQAIDHLTGPAQLRAKQRYVVACALQRMWRTRLQWTLGPHPVIEPGYLDELDLPSLEEEFGQTTLWELCRQEERMYGHNAWAGYTSLMDLLLTETGLKGWGDSVARAG